MIGEVLEVMIDLAKQGMTMVVVSHEMSFIREVADKVLVLADGVEVSLSQINPNDIESISILKDAATSAIYGVRGANGVILITTKTGSKGAATISYDGSATFTTNVAMPEMLNAQDYIGWHNKAREMDGLNPLWTDEVIAGMKEKGIYGETGITGCWKNHCEGQ